MTIRYFKVLALAVLAIAAAGFATSCGSGGSSSGLAGKSAACASGTGGSTFCLLSCSLGCSVGGCTVTDIATNQPIRLVFSQNVDPASANFDTISLKTASGRQPKGRFDVQDNVVQFVPEISISGGQTNFGFKAGETYLMTLPDGSEGGAALESTSGDRLHGSLTCTLRVTQGIVDLDSAPPRARLIAPASTTNVPKDAVIVLEFSEFIDVLPFQGATTQTTPIHYVIRKTMQKIGGQPGERVCDPNSKILILEGLPQAENNPVRGITTITLRPAIELPSQVCIEVTVTNEVTDLAGTPAVPQVFTFTTEILSVGETVIEERFAGDGQLDKQISSGVWSGGKALPPVIGGTGELGPFQVEAGTIDPQNINRFVWNTDNQVIEGRYTPTGQPITVTDGVFEFSEFHLPRNMILSFTGSNRAQIRVRGSMKIEGTIQANSPHVGDFNAASSPFGQLGVAGGPGGARGGKGGDAAPNDGNPLPAYNGRDGEPVKLPAGHGYAAQAANTGGKGAPIFPASGRTTEYCAYGAFNGQVAAGGGGGGFTAPGDVGAATKAPPGQGTECNASANLGPVPTVTSSSFDLGALTPVSTGPDASIEHYCIGGSGGGGGPSHPLLTQKTASQRWLSGAAGAGGGGAIAIRVGQSFEMTNTGRIETRGGNGFAQQAALSLFNVPAPGGGGSGGSCLLQVFGRVTQLGLLDMAGGRRGILNSAGTTMAFHAGSEGGDGSPGYYRIETPAGPSVIDLGSGIPTASSKNAGKLTDREFKGVSQSRFYSTRMTFAPTYLRYILVARIHNQRVVYSDDTELGNPNSPRFDPDYKGLASAAEPVHFQVQGANVNTVTGEPDLNSLSKTWFDAVNSSAVQDLNGDQKNGFRFRLTYDTANGSIPVEVENMKVSFIE